METKKRATVERKRKRSKANLLIGLITLMCVVLFICLVGWIVLKPEPEVIQGEVDADEVRVSGKLAGRILKFNVEEGQEVQAGDTLVYLSTPEIYAKLQQAEGAEAAAQAQDLKAQKGARQEMIDGAFDMWQKAKAGLEIMQKSFARAKKLYDSQVIPAQKFDEAQAQYQVAIATEKAANSQYQMAKNGAEKEDKMAAAALVQRAKGAVSEVKAYMPEMTLLAPISGEISEIFPKRGELVGQGAPIINITDLSSCWVTINVREEKLPEFKMGSICTGVVPALNNKEIKLKVTYVKALGTYATWRATKTSGEFDAKTFEVKAKPLAHIPDLRPGMSVLIQGK